MKTDGGQAFPRPFSKDDGQYFNEHTAQDGMTLHDYFAANCPITLTEFCSAVGFDLATDEFTLSRYAEARISYADAMLKAREEV